MTMQVIVIRLIVFASLISLFAMPQCRSEKDCYDEKELFMEKCQKYIKLREFVDTAPRDSDPCCQAVQQVDMECVCRIITPKEEEEISPIKVYWVSQRCHKPVPAGKPCGSKCPIIFRFPKQHLCCHVLTNTIYRSA